MNIFEYLGLEKNHRPPSNKVTQLVKHWDEVVSKNKIGKTFAVQRKYDGVCAITLVMSGSVSIWSRTGKRFTNAQSITRDIEEMDLRDGVYFGELTVRKSLASLEVWSGIVNPNRVHPLSDEKTYIASKAEMHFFDLVSLNSFILGESRTPFSRRHSILAKSVAPEGRSNAMVTYETLVSEEYINKRLDQEVRNGEEGIVIRDLNAGWVAGHKGWRVMKKVRGCDYDLLCIGYEEGEGKYKEKVANLIFQWKGGKTIKCMLGKGWSHDNAARMFRSAQNGFVDSPVSQIFQVYALEESSKGKLRLPKVGEKRHDKYEPDV